MSTSAGIKCALVDRLVPKAMTSVGRRSRVSFRSRCGERDPPTHLSLHTSISIALSSPPRLQFDDTLLHMRLGLLRHFPVKYGLPRGWMTAAELSHWRDQYDTSEVTPQPLELGAYIWRECLSSDLHRAVATAQAAFAGPIETTSLLREAEFAQFQTGNLRLPVGLWGWILRAAWWSGHGSQRACRDAFLRRVTAAADLLESRMDGTLVVSHGGMMAFLSAELRRRGFTGPKLRLAKHAMLYVYERNDAEA